LRFEPAKSEFGVVNCIWLAEISRLMYRRSGAEPNRHPGAARAEFLKGVALAETAFFADGGTQASLIEG
jgi:hypothetical protein